MADRSRIRAGSRSRPEFAFEYLARCVLRQFVGEYDAAWFLEGCQPIPTVRYEVRSAGFGSRLEYYDRTNALAPVGVRDSDDRCLDDRGVPKENFFHLLALGRLEHHAIVDAAISGQSVQASVLLARHLARTALTLFAAIASDHEPRLTREAVRFVSASADQSAGG